MVLDPHHKPSQDHAAPKLLDRAAKALRDLGLDQQAACAAVEVMRQFVLFHGKRHPQQIGIYEVDQFLDSADGMRQSGAGNRAHAEWALQFLYEQVLRRRWAPQPERRSWRAPAAPQSCVRQRDSVRC